MFYYIVYIIFFLVVVLIPIFSLLALHSLGHITLFGLLECWLEILFLFHVLPLLVLTKIITKV